MIKDIDSLKQASAYVLHHHEHYNGNSYLDKLKGKSIPLGYWLILVADAFDTMTIDRSYRPAMPFEKRSAKSAAVSEHNSALSR